VPNVHIISKINSDNVNGVVASGSGNVVASALAGKKRWWEVWCGTSIILVVTGVIAGLIIWGITHYFDNPSPKNAAPIGTTIGKPVQATSPSERLAFVSPWKAPPGAEPRDLVAASIDNSHVFYIWAFSVNIQN
jgi:hypothetical protein